MDATATESIDFILYLFLPIINLVHYILEKLGYIISKILEGVNITFNINGVFYKRTTDENGTARLNIRLMPGEYIVTSQYGQATISNKITIIAKED